MALLIHGVNYTYKDTNGEEKKGCYGYYSMCLGGLQGNIPANIAMDIGSNESIVEEVYEEDGDWDEEFDVVRSILKGDVPVPLGFIVPHPYSMHIWPLCIPERNSPSREYMMPTGSKWRETIKLSLNYGFGNNPLCTPEEYIKFLRFFCYSTRFSAFFVNLPKKHELTPEWIEKNGIELAFDKGSERDWSYAYTTVRAVTKINCGNFRGWCELEQDYQTPLQKLVLWHLLQQGLCEGGTFTSHHDGCHCISEISAYKYKGFAYRVMYPDAREESLLESGYIQPKKSQYFLFDCSTLDEGRRELRLYRKKYKTANNRAIFKDLIFDEIRVCADMRRNNVWKDK